MGAVWFVTCVLLLITDGALCTPPKPVVMWHGMGMHDISFSMQAAWLLYFLF